jgi:hypothetical protein
LHVQHGHSMPIEGPLFVCADANDHLDLHDQSRVLAVVSRWSSAGRIIPGHPTGAELLGQPQPAPACMCRRC